MVNSKKFNKNTHDKTLRKQLMLDQSTALAVVDIWPHLVIESSRCEYGEVARL